MPHFSCFIIGESRLPIYCAEILLDRGHELKGMVSRDPVVIDWANERHLPVLDYKESEAELVSFLSQTPVDYLFSIFNPIHLPENTLRIPRKLALNYHNGPLPRYAGVYVTTWAILNKETTHGITWHVMTPRLDAGEIFLQKQFELEPDETAFCANWKCFETALETFQAVVERLSVEDHETIPQNLAERTYFSRSKRPPSCGLLNWNEPAEDISALTRALTFENLFNPYFLPKVWLGPKAVIIKRVRISSSSSDTPPGTILDITDSSMTVSTSSQDVIAMDPIDESGDRLSFADLAHSCQFQAGTLLPQISQENLSQLSEYDAKAAKDEAFWMSRLANARPLRTRDLKLKGPGAISPCNDEITTEAPSTNSVFGSTTYPSFERVTLALFSIFLSRKSSLNCFDMGILEGPNMAALQSSPTAAVFSRSLPFRVHSQPESSVRKAVDDLLAQLDALDDRCSYLRDLHLRARKLPEFNGESPATDWPVRVVLAGEFTVDPGHPCLRDAELALVIRQKSPTTIGLSWIHNTDVVTRELVPKIQSEFILFMTAALSNPETPVLEIQAPPYEEGQI